MKQVVLTVADETAAALQDAARRDAAARLLDRVVRLTDAFNPLATLLEALAEEARAPALDENMSGTAA